MRIVVKKSLILLLCVPLYPFVMFAEWYHIVTHVGHKFSFRKSNKEYWKDVWDALTYRKEGGRNV